MLRQTSCSLMECAVVILYALLKLSCLVSGNPGEPGINKHTLEEGPLPSSSLPLPVSSNVFGLINNTAIPLKSTVETKANCVVTTKIVQAQASTRSLALGGGVTSMTLPEARTSAGLLQSKASTVNLAHTSIEDGVSSTILSQARTSVVMNVSHLSTMQTPSIKQSEASTSDLAHTSIAGGVSLTSLPQARTTVVTSAQATGIEQSQVQTANLTGRSISEDATLTSLPLTSTVLMNQNQSASHAVSDQGSMTSKASLPSSSPVKPLLSTSSISPSGLADHSTSYVMPSSTVIINASKSQGIIHSTTVKSSTVQTLVYHSSSVMPSLPTTSPRPGVPDPPVIQDTNVLSGHFVILYWNTTSGQSIANFSVELSVDSASWKQATCNHSLVPGDCVVTQKEAVITQLKPYTNYTFRVVAKSQFGISNYSTESKWIRTGEAAPSAAPVITAAYNVSSQEIFLAWQPPPSETLNGKVQKYEIHIKKVTLIQPTTLPTSKVAGSSVAMPSMASSSSSVLSTPVPTTPSGGSHVTEPIEPTEEPEERTTPQDGSPVVIDAGLVLNYTVGNLDKWTSYEVKVRAVTIAPGPFSDKVIVRTDESVPSQPRQVFAKAVNSNAIFVNWTEPVEMNGLLVKYQVKYSEKDSLEAINTKDVGQNKSVLLTALNPFTLYVINVSAFTRKGEGSPATVEELTDEGRPSPPRNLTAKSINSSAILVSWVTPVNLNGKIKYRLSFNKRSELVYDGNGTRYLVSNLKPYTQYTFSLVAYNIKYNLTSAAVHTLESTPQDAPSGHPQNVRAITNSSSSIILYWLPPRIDQQNGVITHYKIRVSTNNPMHLMMLRTTADTRTLPITGLQAYTNYSFAVQAVNVAGIGPYSSIVTNRTFEAEPSAPRNVTAKSVNSSAIKVTWIEALHPNGIIRYKLYMRLSKEDEQTNRLVYKGMDTSYVAADLQEYVMYTFTVVSFNIKYNWTSKPVVAMETTHPAEPSGSPQDVHAWTLSSTSIRVKWRPPLPAEQNGLILKYTVTYTSQSGQTKSLDTADNSTSVEVKNLTIFMKYSFTVKAWNVIGVGPGSEEVYNTTFEDRPSPPVNVVAKTVNSTAIKVTWQVPLNPNGEIYYRLYYWQSSEGAGTKRRAYDGPLLEHIVAGLHEFVTYIFMLQAYNVKHSWSSTATNATETTHPAEPSGAPLNVKAFTKSSTSILVQWNPPNELDRNGVITHYIVQYSSLGTQASINTTDNTTEILVTRLKKYTTYYFTVRAVNKIGVGPRSKDDAQNTTSEDLPGEPVIVNVIRKTNSLELTWKPPAEPNGIIKTFRLCWTPLAVHNISFVSLNGDASWYEIRNLKAFTEYNVSLAASTSVGLGPNTTHVYKTAEGVPSKPQDLQAWNTSKSSIFVTWKKPASINGNLQGYKVFNRLASDTDEVSPKDVGLRTNISLSGLEPYTLYNVTVQAFTGAGGGEKSNVNVMTDESEPSAVREVSIPADKITSYSIEVTWLRPEKPNGIIGYYFYYWKTSAGSSTAKSFVLQGSVHYKLVGGLKPFTYYTFSVVPYNLKKNLSGPPFNREGQTSAAVPSGPPRNVVINSTTSTSFTLTWDPPLEPNGIIQGYDVMYYECDDPNKKNINDNVNERVHTIEDLHPARCYRIYVACQSSGGLGPFSDWVEKRTEPGAPPPLGTLAPPDEVDSFSFSVKLKKALNEKGAVRYYQVIVRELATDNKDQPVRASDPDSYREEDLYTYEKARKMKPQLVPYIAAEFRASDFHDYENFVVGDGQRTSKVSNDILSRRRRRDDSNIEFYNGPLEENTFYAVFQRAYVNKDVYTSSSWIEPVETAAAVKPTQPSSTNVGLIVGLVLVLILLPIVLAAVYLIIRRKRRNSDTVLDDRDDYSNGRPVKMKKLSRKRRSLQKKRLMGSTESLTGLEELAASRARRHPVPIDDFERHVDRMHMDGDHGFSEEYLLVQPEEEFSFQQFLNPANKYKNRYANIVAYDHTRVLLNPIEGVAGSDYINANFIDGYNRQRAYIAAQGPLMETFDDFWRMMWEQMSSVIVMLTKLEERGRRKCDQYWPERGTRNYGQIQVTLKETLNMSHYTVRKLVMTHKMYPDDERVVKQFHFTAWPDHGVPSHPTPLLSLVRHTFSANRESIGPMLVHCSAGVGRTGTFITLGCYAAEDKSGRQY
ncbi:hypothetical protein ACROYT_G025850 [Oculina patagonica]